MKLYRVKTIKGRYQIVEFEIIPTDFDPRDGNPIYHTEKGSYEIRDRLFDRRESAEKWIKNKRKSKEQKRRERLIKKLASHYFYINQALGHLNPELRTQHNRKFWLDKLRSHIRSAREILSELRPPCTDAVLGGSQAPPYAAVLGGANRDRLLR